MNRQRRGAAVHVHLHSFEQTERTAAADAFQNRCVDAEGRDDERTGAKREKRHAANRQLLHGNASEHHLLLRFAAHIQLFGPEVFELRNLADRVLLHGRGVVQRPRDDDLLPGKGIRLVGLGHQTNRIAIGGDQLTENLRRIVRAGRRVGENLDCDRRERFDLSAQSVQRDRPDGRRSRCRRMRGVRKNLAARAHPVDPVKFRRQRWRTIERQILQWNPDRIDVRECVLDRHRDGE